MAFGRGGSTREDRHVTGRKQPIAEHIAPAVPAAMGSWMEYISTEVSATCRQKGWGVQIRRKWSVREKPVASSGIDDYEWKLIPDGRVYSDLGIAGFEEGVYYVLGFDS